ncbi:hypothetical protein LINPERHAP1_LOCUS18455 [Linum perenne]
MEYNNKSALTVGDFYVDLESGPNNGRTTGEVLSTNSSMRSLFNKVYSVFMEEEAKQQCGNGSNSEDGSNNETSSGSDHSEEKKQQRRKSSSPHKKSPKPPRPPQGPSLDAADIKLIKEISELAMLKRARIERIKALKKAKAAAKQSSTPLGSCNGNLFAIVLTVLFFIVIICQGMSSRISSIDLQTAPVPASTMDSDLISVQYFENPYVDGPTHKYVTSHSYPSAICLVLCVLSWQDS